MTRQRKVLATGTALIVLAGMSYCTHGFVTAGERVRAVCAGMAPGMAVGDAVQYGLAHGLSGVVPDTGEGFLVEGRSFGRHGCRLETSQGSVVAVAYHFAD